MQKLNIYILLSILVIAAISIFTFSKNSNEMPGRSYKESYHADYKIYNPPMPEKADFCGEETPLNIYYINEKLEREILVNTYWHSNTLLLFKRANRWFPLIDSILNANKIPSDFKYLALIESGLTQAVSPSGARGFWQIMKKTAIQYNLEVNREIDERYNIEKSTQAACDYINDSYNIYKNWTLVAASYNMGRGGINKQLELQKVSNYYDLSLNSETGRYVYRIIALKTIFSTPSKYGFQLRESDLYPSFKTKYVKIDSSFINWADFANTNNISYGMLKELNPWLKTSTLTNKYKKEYKVKVPTEEMYLYQGVKSKMNKKIGVYGEKK
jgi:hypothetical protein